MGVSAVKYVTGQYATTGDLVTAGGLVLVATNTFSAAASVSINSCFSDTYQNYLVELVANADALRAITMRLRVAAADSSAANYYQMSPGLADGGGVAGVNQAAATSFSIGSANATDASTLNVVFYNPFATARTLISGTHIALNAGGTNFDGRAFNALFAATTSFDGFSIIPAAGTVTGTVRIYGYKNS